MIYSLSFFSKIIWEIVFFAIGLTKTNKNKIKKLLKWQAVAVASRRSTVLSCNAAVATSNPIASDVGLQILRTGVNAADAAVGVAATLNLVEPEMTGFGGDCFCLFYNSSTKGVEGINGR